MTLKLTITAGILAALAWSAVGMASRPADPPKPTDRTPKPNADPWVGEFRVYDGSHRDKGEFVAVPSARHGGKVTVAQKGDEYLFDGQIRLRKVNARLEPINDAGFKWIELGEKGGDGFHTLTVVGGFKVEYLVRGQPPTAWTVVAGDGKPGRRPKPPGSAVTNWKACREYTLDGTDSVRVDDHPELRVPSLTLSAWVNTADAGSMQPIVAKAQAKGNWCSYMLRIQDGGRVSLIVENAAGERSAHWRTKERLTAKKQHHIAATWANTRGDASDAKIYIDGAEQQVEMNRSVGYGKDFRIGYTDGPLYIGRDEMPSGHFVGTLRDVEVLGRVMTPEKVKALASKGATAALATPDLAVLQGSWTLVSYRVDGVTLRGEDPASTFTVEENRWTSSWRKDGGDQIEQGEVKSIDAKGNPRVADLVHTFGTHKGTTTRVLYRVDGDSLWYASVVESGGKIVTSTLTWKRKSAAK